MSADPALTQDAATVWTDAAGAPRRLVWEGRRFLVSARPIPWIDRVPWWTQSPRAAVGTAEDLLERRMWQVQATAEDGQILIFDLQHSPGPLWPVTAIYD